MTILRSLFLALVLGPATAPLHAQFIQLGGTGCPVTTAPTTFGAPRLGNVISVSCPSCSVAQSTFVVIGSCAPTPYLAFFPPLTCTIGPCYLAVNPIAIATMPAYFSAMIPFNAALVGQSFCLQCGCLSAGTQCFRLWTALQIRIQ